MPLVQWVVIPENTGKEREVNSQFATVEMGMTISIALKMLIV